MFLLDSNVLIAAKNRYYAFDLAPGFWTWLESEFDGAGVRSIHPVRTELLAQEDELAAWAKRMHPAFWLREGDAEVRALRAVAEWTMSGDREYRQDARTDFLAKADYRLVAFGHAGGHSIVTHEVSAPESLRAIKIPDAARAFDVECVEPFALFRALGLRLDARPGS